MARRWFVQTADSKIVASTDDDDADTPTGTDAVDDATIREADPPGANGIIRPLGKWDGAHYSAPTGDDIRIPFDADTADGRVQLSALLADNQLLAWIAILLGIASGFPQDSANLGHNLLAFARRGLRARLLSETPAWAGEAKKIKFCEEIASGAANVTSPAEFYQLLETETIVDPASRPDPRCLWTNPDTNIRVDLQSWTTAVDATDGAGDTVLSRLAPETDDLGDYVTQRWIADVTA